MRFKAEFVEDKETGWHTLYCYRLDSEYELEDSGKLERLIEGSKELRLKEDILPIFASEFPQHEILGSNFLWTYSPYMPLYMEQCCVVPPEISLLDLWRRNKIHFYETIFNELN